MGKNVAPYNFVPLDRGKTRVEPVDPTDPKLLKGTIHCTLEVKTPLFIPNTTGDVFFMDGEDRIRAFFSYDIFTSKPVQSNRVPEKPIIPGSSIRGALRSVFEAASNSCLRVTDVVYRNHVPWNYRPCTGMKWRDGYDLCPACSLFGMIGGEKDGISYASRIRVTDAVPVNEVTYTWRRIPQQYGPKIARCIDQNCNQIKGRKFYWHHRPKESTLHSGRDLIQSIDQGAVFNFCIHFDGITERELRQLIAVIRLNGEGMHKLGAAKPLGFGSVEMRVNRIVQHQTVFKNGRIAIDRNNITECYQSVTVEDSFGREDNNANGLMDILRFDAIEWPDNIDVQYRPTTFSPGNGQEFIDGSIQDIVGQINRDRREFEDRMSQMASEEDLKKLVAIFNKKGRR